MKRIIKVLLSALTTTLLLTALTVTVCADTIPGTAQLTITPTETKISGDTATVTYAVTVTPPEGKELGVFSIQLQPSDGMTLTQDTSKMTFGDGNLTYNAATGKGIFATYGYTPQTGYFAAVGTTPERRMSDQATVLTIQATMPADKAGTYTLGAEFIAALDGSGDTYTARVSTTPVTISAAGKEPVADKTPVVTENGQPADSQSGDSQTTADGTTTGTDAVGSTGTTGSNTDGSTVPGGDTAIPDGDASTSADSPSGGDTATPSASASPALWIVLAVLAAVIVVVVVIVRKKRK